ncbi:MAG: hypothetical protein P4M11_12780 [Candidatus Pacebacteria bacterium]|nr:hypothetical protein [Candidatus Paceibacterota bacterium]
MDENKFAQFRDPADNPANRLGPGLPAPHFVGPVSPLEQPAMSPQNHSSNLADIAAGSHCPVCNQIYYSARCQYFYLALILANVVMIIWTLLMYQDIRGTMPRF